jgi:hypothetical protein
MLLCLTSRNKQSAYYCPKIASLKQGEISSYLANTPKKRLTFSNILAHALGGEIRLKESSDEGTTFVLRLKLDDRQGK